MGCPTPDTRHPIPVTCHPMILFLSVDDLPRLFVMVLLAAVLGYVAHLLTGKRVPLGFFGTTLFGVLGAWVAADVVRPRIPIALPKEPVFDGVTLITAGLGAFLFALAWCLVASRFARRRW